MRKTVRRPVAIVSGASRGLGAACARRLSERGLHVVLSARDEFALRRVAKTLHGPSTVVPFDLRDLAETQRACAQVIDTLGAPDIVLSVAGVWHDKTDRYQGPRFSKTSVSRISEVVEVGLLGGLRLVRALLPSMEKRRKGHIVFFGCGFAGAHEARNWVPYYVTNKSLEALAAGLGAELRKNRIRVNAIAPWFVATEYVKKFYPESVKTALSVGDVVCSVDALLFGPLRSFVSGQTIELRSEGDDS